jgi:VanZ family protein
VGGAFAPLRYHRLHGRRVYKLLILTLVLIAYGSLYPWQFESPSSAPFASPIVELADVVINVIAYVPLGAIAFLALVPIRGRVAAVLYAALIGLACSALMEAAQVYIPGRVSGASDLIANTAGALAGAVALSKLNTARLDSVSLIICWIGWQLCPFFPSVHRPRLTIPDRLSAMTITDFLLDTAAMLALWKLLESLRGLHRKRLIFAVLLLLAAVKLFIAGRTVSAVELVAAVVAFALVILGNVPTRSVAALLAAAIALHGLAPFHLRMAQNNISLMPFAASLASNWVSATVVLFGKVFLYGSLLWLLRASGIAPVPGAIAVIVLLSVIEFAQIWLPGRTPETTDPMLAAILALGLSSTRVRSPAM